jgi:predicted Zn-ribbon and HTH transcriptional regulator
MGVRNVRNHEETVVYGGLKNITEVHAELRRCRSCGVEYIFRVLADGTQINARCPRCEGKHAVTIKVYPRRDPD